jgi:alkylhydroperoxidase family enzyme
MSHGPRVREVDEPGDDPILQDLYAKEQDAFGFVLNTTRVMAQRPGILRAAKQLGAAIDRSGLLPKELVALVNLRVALINGCPF